MSRITIPQSARSTKKRTSQPAKRGCATKTVYKVTNWHDYNNALVERGSLHVWISEEVFEAWYAEKDEGVGAPKRYSDTCIQTCLTLKALYTRKFRQTEGLVRSILRMLGRPEDVPDFSTLSRRSGSCNVSIRVRDVGDHIELYPDSTGIKVSGEGEWKVRKHKADKRRRWVKMHLGVTPHSDIVSVEVTDNETHDCEVMEQLLEVGDTAITALGADGAYDTAKIYDLLQQNGIQDIRIPPQKNAKIWRHGNLNDPPHPRDQNLRAIRKSTKRAWKRACGYHKRSISETSMFRFKITFGDKSSARTLANQTTEVRIKVRALNIMNTLGMPIPEKVTR